MDQPTPAAASRISSVVMAALVLLLAIFPFTKTNSESSAAHRAESLSENRPGPVSGSTDATPLTERWQRDKPSRSSRKRPWRCCLGLRYLAYPNI